MSVINKMKKIYTNIPLGLINSLAPLYHCIPESQRYGKVFNEQVKYLEKIETLSENKIQELINLKFIEMVKHAYNNVPYYHNLFDEYGISVTSFKDTKDIVMIPFLTKELLIQYREELIATNVDRKSLQYITTSGSTGNPVGFYVDSDSTMKEWAYTVNLWSRVGYSQDSSRLLLRGKTFYLQNKREKNWQYDALRKELSCNIFDLCEENLEEYCEAIEKFKPEFIHGYMSATTVLCKYIENRTKVLNHKFKAVLAVSENVLDLQREYVEKVLGCRVFSFYGHSERLVMAGECEYSSEYHIEPLYGYAEIVDKNGEQITNGSIGEIIATGFCNKSMPMLRYKTGDLAGWSKMKSCECGRPHIRIESVHGRWKQDFLINSDNALVSLTAINMHSDVFDRVVRFQFFQDTIGKVVLKIMPTGNFSKNNEIEILKILNEKTQSKIEYSIQLVENIPVKSNGKYAVIDQKLKVAI